MPGAPSDPAPTNDARVSQVSSAWNLLDTPLAVHRGNGSMPPSSNSLIDAPPPTAFKSRTTPTSAR